MLELILLITLAHVIGDFVLQTKKMVVAIDTKKLQSKYLYLHALIHLVLVLLMTKFEKQYILPAFI